MDKATTISAVGHLGVILWAVLGGWLFAPKDMPPMQVASVSLMSEGEYQAMMASAPKPDPAVQPAETPPVIQPPEPVDTALPEPQAPAEPTPVEEVLPAEVPVAPEVQPVAVPNLPRRWPRKNNPSPCPKARLRQSRVRRSALRMCQWTALRTRQRWRRRPRRKCRIRPSLTRQ